MRDPKRIKPLLDEFKKLWKENPDMRFGQLVVCILGTDPFYIEDDETLKTIYFFRKNLYLLSRRPS